MCDIFSYSQWQTTLQSNPIQWGITGAGRASLPASPTTINTTINYIGYRLVDHRFQLSHSHNCIQCLWFETLLTRRSCLLSACGRNTTVVSPVSDAIDTTVVSVTSTIKIYKNEDMTNVSDGWFEVFMILRTTCTAWSYAKSRWCSGSLNRGTL